MKISSLKGLHPQRARALSDKAMSSTSVPLPYDITIFKMSWILKILGVVPSDPCQIFLFPIICTEVMNLATSKRTMTQVPILFLMMFHLPNRNYECSIAIGDKCAMCVNMGCCIDLHVFCFSCEMWDGFVESKRVARSNGLNLSQNFRVCWLDFMSRKFLDVLEHFSKIEKVVFCVS